MGKKEIHPFAKSIDVDLGLSRFVAWWNTGDPFFSLVTNFETFEEAFAMDGDRWNAYADLCEAGERMGVDSVEEIERLLISTISSSLARAMSKRAEIWARDIVDAGPTRFGVGSPFATASEWVRFCIERIDPPTISSPQGTSEMPLRDMKPWLEKGLRKLSVDATKAGWIADRAEA